MYVSKHHQLNDRDAILALMETHPLGTWVCHTKEGLVANHVPFLLDRTHGPYGTLLGHVARANSIWRVLSPDIPSIVTFLGAQSYITPGWYPGKAEHGKVVPTWNYVVAHAHGTARVIEDPTWMLNMLNRLTDAQETGQTVPWNVEDAPPDYIHKLMRGIVGIEIRIDRVDGKLKASQDEDMQDRYGTVKGLQSSHNQQSQNMAGLVLNTLTSEMPQS